MEYGTVVLGPKEVDDRQVVQPLKDVIRMATQKDDAKEESNRKKEKEAYQVCVKKIRAHQLEMKLIDVEYTFDNNKILFYFTADGRIDFRELVKDLAAIFKTRIELRQIGVRDEDSRRYRYLRSPSVLPYLSVRICSGIDQDGERAESVTESDQNLRCLRPSDVLPEK